MSSNVLIIVIEVRIKYDKNHNILVCVLPTPNIILILKTFVLTVLI